MVMVFITLYVIEFGGIVMSSIIWYGLGSADKRLMGADQRRRKPLTGRQILW